MYLATSYESKKKKLVSTNTCNPFNFSVDEARELTDEVENILA